MNGDQVGQTPILGREGLLRLVEVVERLRARARGEEGGSWTTGEDPGPTGGDQAVLGGAAGGQPPGGGRCWPAAWWRCGCRAWARRAPTSGSWPVKEGGHDRAVAVG